MDKLKITGVTDHPYHCACGVECLDKKTWQPFYEEWKDIDLDNLHVFRFDLRHKDEENICGEEYLLSLLVTRGGHCVLYHVEVKKEDFAEVEQFLQPHYEKLKHLWAEFSGVNNGRP